MGDVLDEETEWVEPGSDDLGEGDDLTDVVDVAAAALTLDPGDQ